MRICGCELGCDFFFFKQKTAYELRISDGVQTCALPICSMRAASFPRDVAAPTDARPPPRCWSVVCYAVALPTRRRLIRCRRQRKRRSEERRVGKASVSTCSSRWSLYHYITHTTDLLFNTASLTHFTNQIYIQYTT